MAMPADHASVCQTGVAIGPPKYSPRIASVSAVTGFTLTHACSHPSSVWVCTNTLLPNVSGNITMNPNPCTLCGDLTVRPSNAHTQHSADANTTRSPKPASANQMFVSTRKPSSDP